MSIAQRFMDLFSGNDRAHGTFNVKETSRESDGKKQGVARIIKEPTTLQHWQDHLDGGTGLGIIPIRDDNTCRWGCIDIDQYDFDHRGFIEKAKTSKVPCLTGRSKSGGGHIFFFFSEPLDAGEVLSKLAEISAYLGHGGCEVFPKQGTLLVERGDTGNFLNMPYYAGVRTTRYILDDQGDALSPEEFLEYAEARKLTAEQFYGIKTKRENKKGPLPDGPPCLQHLAAQGFGEGSRNNALFNLGVYARMAFPEEWEGRLHQYNIEFVKPPLGHNEVGTIIKQLQKKEGYFYKCNDQPINAYCDKGTCCTRKFGVGSGPSACELSSLVKIDGDPPIWIVNVDGQRVELPTEALQQQQRFQKECIARLNKFPPIIPQPAWQKKMQTLLDNVTVVEANADATLAGEFEDHLYTFCCERAKGAEREDILQGIAVWAEDRVFFQVKDLRKHLSVNDFESFSSTKLVMALTDMRAVKTFWRIKGKGLHVWSLPQDQFRTEEEATLELPPLAKAKDVF